MDSHDRRHLSDEMEVAELRNRLEKAERLAEAVSHLYDYEWPAGTAERLDPLVKAWREFRGADARTDRP